MKKRHIMMGIEHVGAVFILADENSELETRASELLSVLWDAYDEAKDDE